MTSTSYLSSQQMILGHEGQWSTGPSIVGSLHSFPQQASSSSSSSAVSSNSFLPRSHTLQPITTGTSVFGLVFKDGVMLAADTLGSYGSLARFPSIERLYKINKSAVMGCSGDLADIQFLRSVVDAKQTESDLFMMRQNSVDATMKPRALHAWLTRVLYHRRSRIDPLWTTVVVGGVQDDQPFLGYVDMLGTAFTADAIATGLGKSLCLPILREAHERVPPAQMTASEAELALKQAIRLSYLRDCRASATYQMAVITKEGETTVSKPQTIDSDWEFARYAY